MDKELLEETPESYFSAQEWENIASMQRLRCANQLANFNLLQNQGLRPQKPDFVVDFENRQNKSSQRTGGPLQNGQGGQPEPSRRILKKKGLGQGQEGPNPSPSSRPPIVGGERSYPQRSVPRVNYFNSHDNEHVSAIQDKTSDCNPTPGVSGNPNKRSCVVYVESAGGSTIIHHQDDKNTILGQFPAASSGTSQGLAGPSAGDNFKSSDRPGLVKSSKIYRCHHCAFSTNHEPSFTEHNTVVHTQKKQYLCNVCGGIFGYKATLKRHLQKQHQTVLAGAGLSAGDSFKSSDRQSSTKYNSFKSSYRQSSTKYKCRHCAFITPQKGKWKIHQVVHTKEKPYSCKICGARYPYAHSLKRHLDKKHKIGAIKQNLSTSTATNSTPYPSPTKAQPPAASSGVPQVLDGAGPSAGDTFPSSDTPILVHSSRIYKCHHCAYSTDHKDALTRHQVVHTGEKPYLCKFCGAKYPHSTSLTRHLVRKHKGAISQDLPTTATDKPGKKHQCQHCAYSTDKKSDLINHQVIHTGEQPYQCNFCGSKFNLKSNRNRHLKKIHGQ